MSVISTTIARPADIPRGSRGAAAQRRSRLGTAVSGLAVDLIAALSIGAFMAAVLLWGCIFAGRL